MRRQEKINKAEERDFRRRELPGKYMAKMLYRWDDKKLEKNWKRWKEDRQIDENKYLKRIEEREEEEKMNKRDWRTGYFSRGEILKGGNVKITESGLCFFSFILIFSIFRTLGLCLEVISHI